MLHKPTFRKIKPTNYPHNGHPPVVFPCVSLPLSFRIKQTTPWCSLNHHTSPNIPWCFPPPINQSINQFKSPRGVPPPSFQIVTFTPWCSTDRPSGKSNFRLTCPPMCPPPNYLPPLPRHGFHPPDADNLKHPVLSHQTELLDKLLVLWCSPPAPGPPQPSHAVLAIILPQQPTRVNRPTDLLDYPNHPVVFDHRVFG